MARSLSEKICQEYWDEFVIGSLDECGLIIQYMRSIKGSETALGALVDVGERWRKEKFKKTRA
jgi:hypothetical protein